MLRSLGLFGGIGPVVENMTPRSVGLALHFCVVVLSSVNN